MSFREVGMSGERQFLAAGVWAYLSGGTNRYFLYRWGAAVTYAKVIADSVSPDGHRLTTMEVRFHRFVLAEFNTHRVFSRNSASSRAIPFHKQVERVISDPAIPVSWPAEKPGMQGGEELEDTKGAETEWLEARDNAVVSAKYLAEWGVHKSVVNRLLEPFMWHTVIVTATEWDGFWAQRCSPLAQPEIRVAAEAMREAYTESVPYPMLHGEWHTPYMDGDTMRRVYAETKGGAEFHERIRRISVARCARVSYLTHDGKRDIQADLDLYDKLVSARPMHASPLEHVATPASTNHRFTPGNFRGWAQLRHFVEDGVEL